MCTTLYAICLYVLPLQLLKWFKPSSPWTQTYVTKNVCHRKPTEFSSKELEDELFQQFLTTRFHPRYAALLLVTLKTSFFVILASWTLCWWRFGWYWSEKVIASPMHHYHRGCFFLGIVFCLLFVWYSDISPCWYPWLYYYKGSLVTLMWLIIAVSESFPSLHLPLFFSVLHLQSK